MAHFMQLIDSKHLGALNFTDENMQPKPRELTIREVKPGRPPNGKADRWETFFVETDKSAFFATSQIKKLANELMCADPAKWSGAKLTITCEEVKSPKGGTTMGMRIIRAVRAPKPAAKEPTNAQ